MIPGEYQLKNSDITINEYLDNITLEVTNKGDRPIQIGSHYHFYEVNLALKFNRKIAYGKHLDIPSGNAVRFEPGEKKKVLLVPFTGRRIIYGFRKEILGKLK